jgi:hypothetical protein
MSTDGDRRIVLLASVWTLLQDADETPTAAVDAVLATAALDALSPATRGMSRG